MNENTAVPIEEQENKVVSMTDLFGNYRLAPKVKVGERALLMGDIARKTGIEIGHLAGMLGHLKDPRDLYYILSDIKQAHARGVPYSAALRASLKLPV